MSDESKAAFDDVARVERDVRGSVAARLDAAGADMALQALAYATAKHAGQTRDDGLTPYIIHPMRVGGSLMTEFGLTTPALVAAAFLHDVIEDRPDVSAADIADAFGPDVAHAVDLMTKYKAAPDFSDEAYIARIWRAGPDFCALKVADRLDNLRSLEWHEKRGKVETYIRETRHLHLPLAARVGPDAVVRLTAQIERLIALFGLDPATTEAAPVDFGAKETGV